VTAGGITLVFLGGHLANHVTGLFGPDTYNHVMAVLRHVYRARLVEPILVIGFLFQAVSGLYFAWRYTARPADRFRIFQIASGMYLVFFLISHINAVLILARNYLHIDSNWAFATGAPAGLIDDAWNIRLVPLYGLAVFFLLSHLFAGLRVVVIGHGGRRETANAILTRGTAAAALISALIMFGMCGLRIHFTQTG
jgi:hypothetical protein